MAKVGGQRSSGGIFDTFFNLGDLVQISGVLAALKNLSELEKGVMGYRFREVELYREIVRDVKNMITRNSYSCIGISYVG
ncbi:hypothetical protein [Anaplasma bovis]|uniref:hypothetical protein n=1 Tax=Anaplasma bovis TaxID=186733 RepID=UPI002FF18DF9